MRARKPLIRELTRPLMVGEELGAAAKRPQALIGTGNNRREGTVRARPIQRGELN